MRAAVITRERLMVVADAWDVETHCRAREAMWAFAKSPPVNSYQQRKRSQARGILKRKLG